MIMDAQLLFSDAQAVTAAAASTNYVDLKAARDIGNGKDLYLVSVVDVAMTDGSSNSTLTVDLQTDDNSSFSSAATGCTAFSFPALSAIGTTLIRRLGPGDCNEQYMRVYYTPVNGDLSTGSFTTFITTEPYKYASYPDNVTIS